ncbi:MAG: FAD-dependent oxidoreductase [Candidatus Geothermarchaeales archaeon]
MSSVKRKPSSRLQLQRVPVRRLPPDQRITTVDEVVLGYTEEQALREASRCLSCRSEPCTKACPINQRAMEYVTLIKEGRYRDAYAVIRADNPLGAVCGRVCYHPCEEWDPERRLGCVIGIKGEPVSIMRLKRFVYDTVQEPVQEVVTVEPKEQRVAIIGSGPAGLVAAHDLALLGYRVTIFERHEELGGMLTLAIPEYRLPREAIQSDIDRILSLGVQVEAGRDVESLEEIRARFHAVLVATGAPSPRHLGVEGESLEGVHNALDFLLKVNTGEDVDVGRRAAVIGGGDVAMDAARTALRLGAETTVVYRRSEREMPVDPEQYQEAKEEGVGFIFLMTPWRIMGEGRVSAMECQRMRLGEQDESGRRRPVAIDGAIELLPVDSVLVAIGERPDLSLFPGALKTTRWGTPVVDESYATNLEGVFAAGDVVTGPSTIVEAMAAGRGAARAIVKHLTEIEGP